MFSVSILRGHKYDDYESFRQKCIFYLKDKAKEGCGIRIITNGDEFVDKFCKRYGIDYEVISTDWMKNGTSALATRNKKMLDKSNAVILFNDGTNDIKYMCKMTQERGIPYRIISL